MPPRRRQEPIALTAPDAAPARRPTKTQESAAEEAPAPARKPVFKQRSVYLEQELWERARAAIAYIKYFEVIGEPDTLAELISAGIEVKVTELEAAYNGGEPFKPAARKLPTGPGRAGLRRLENRSDGA